MTGCVVHDKVAYIHTVTEDTDCNTNDVSQRGDKTTSKNQTSDGKNKWRERWLDMYVTVDMKVMQLHSVTNRPKLNLAEC